MCGPTSEKPLTPPFCPGTNLTALWLGTGACFSAVWQDCELTPGRAVVMYRLPARLVSLPLRVCQSVNRAPAGPGPNASPMIRSVTGLPLTVMRMVWPAGRLAVATRSPGRK